MTTTTTTTTLRRQSSGYNPYFLGDMEISNILFYHGGEVKFNVGRGWLEGSHRIGTTDCRQDVVEITVPGEVRLARTVETGMKRGGCFYTADPRNKNEGARWGRKYWVYIPLLPEMLPEQPSYRTETHQHYWTPVRLVLPLMVRYYDHEGDRWGIKEQDHVIMTGSSRSEPHADGVQILALQATLEAAGVKLGTSEAAKLWHGFTVTPKVKEAWTVTVSGREKLDGEKPYTYCVNASTAEHAVQMVKEHHSREQEDYDITVEEVTQGTPDDRPMGFHWNDLR